MLCNKLDGSIEFNQGHCKKVTSEKLGKNR